MEEQLAAGLGEGLVAEFVEDDEVEAAQTKLGDKGFLSRAIVVETVRNSVRDLLLNRADVHHVYPRAMLKRQGRSRGRYNQIANFVIAQSEIIIAIGDTPPAVVLDAVQDQVAGRPLRDGGITDPDALAENLDQNCIPTGIRSGRDQPDDAFPAERRRLMAQRMRTWFQGL